MTMEEAMRSRHTVRRYTDRRLPREVLEPLEARVRRNNQEHGLAMSLGNLSGILQNPTILSKAQTYAFTVLGMSQLFHAVGMRDTHKSFFRMHHLENKLMIAACAAGFALQMAVTEIPFLIGAFGTSPLSGSEWMRLTILAAAPLFAHEIIVLCGFFHPSRK